MARDVFIRFTDQSSEECWNGHLCRFLMIGLMILSFLINQNVKENMVKQMRLQQEWESWTQPYQ